MVFVFTIVCAVSPSYWLFLPSAMMCGLNYGGSLSIAYTFWAEVSSTHFR